MKEGLFSAKRREYRISLSHQFWTRLGSCRDTAVFLIIHETGQNYNAADTSGTRLPHGPLAPSVDIQILGPIRLLVIQQANNMQIKVNNFSKDVLSVKRLGSYYTQCQYADLPP